MTTSALVVPPVELDLGTAPLLAAEIAQALFAGAAEVTVDFACVSFCDSSGVRVMVHAMKLARAHGALLTIRRPSRQLLLITHLLGAADLLNLPPPD